MSKYEELQKYPMSLRTLTEVADVEDLDVLVDYITDNGEGRLALDSDVCKQLVDCRKIHLYTETDRKQIADEILLFGGNSLANVYRELVNKTLLGSLLPGAEPTTDYETVVKDVAKQAGATFGEKDDVITTENAIVLKIFKQALEKMTEIERKKVMDELGITNINLLTGASFLGVAAATMAARPAAIASLSVFSTVATAISTQMLGRAVVAGPAILGGRALAALAGPIGIAVGTLWTLAGLSSPAYRVTLPCVVQLAFMRQKYLSALNVITCSNCAAENYIGSKFCSSCGTALVGTRG